MRTMSNIDAETTEKDSNIDYDKLLFRYGILTQMVKVIFSVPEVSNYRVLRKNPLLNYFK